MWRILTTCLSTFALYNVVHGNIILSDSSLYPSMNDVRLMHNVQGIRTPNNAKGHPKFSHGPFGARSIPHGAQGLSRMSPDVVIAEEPADDANESAHSPQLAEVEEDNTVVMAGVATAGVGVVALSVGAGVQYSVKKKKVAQNREVDLEAEKYILEWSGKNVLDEVRDPRRVVPRPDPSEFEPIAPPRCPAVRKSFMMHDGHISNTMLCNQRDTVPDDAAHFEVGIDTFWMED